jgi:predicted nucleotidyltransferase
VISRRGKGDDSGSRTVFDFRDFERHARKRRQLCRRGDPVKPSDALRLHRVAVREAAGRFRSTNPRVFGSVAHGADEEGSDLDILVDALPGATLFDLGALQVELEDLLGVSVDLLTPGDLPPKLRETILADAQPI